MLPQTEAGAHESRLSAATSFLALSSHFTKFPREPFPPKNRVSVEVPLWLPRPGCQVLSIRLTAAYSLTANTRRNRLREVSGYFGFVQLDAPPRRGKAAICAKADTLSPAPTARFIYEFSLKESVVSRLNRLLFGAAMLLVLATFTPRAWVATRS